MRLRARSTLPIALLVLAGCTPASAVPTGTPARTEAAQRPGPSYTVRPVARDGLLELDVILTFAGDASGHTRVRLPADRFGVADMHRHVRGVRVGAGAHSSTITDSVIELHHLPEAMLEIRYSVRFDSASAGFAAYGPSVSDRHFHFLGSQWMARVAPDSTHRFDIRVERGDLTGALAGSFGLGPGSFTVDATQDEMDWTVLAGGDYREDRFTCQDRPLVTLVNGAFDVPDDTIFAVARRVACGQRDAFDDHEQPFYAIIMTARQRLRAGASFMNAFACFARSDSSADQLASLLAHEMMHAWLPRRLRIVPAPDEALPAVTFSWFHDIRYDWFHEGFTEYLSRVLQVRTGLADEDWFVERLNDDIARLAVHPYRTSSVHELEQAALYGRYTNWHQRLSYLRGTLLAFRWDAAIRRASGDTNDLLGSIRRLLAAGDTVNGRLDRIAFTAIMTELGVPEDDVQRHAVAGDPIPIDSLGLGENWMLRNRSVPAFEPGFDVVVSTNADTVMGVRRDGLAYAAGLRDGMPIVRVANAWRWDDEWRADLPLAVVVMHEGAERTFEYSPIRGELSIPSFIRREGRE